MTYPPAQGGGHVLEAQGSAALLGAGIYLYQTDWLATGDAEAISVAVSTNNPASVGVEEGIWLPGSIEPTPVAWTLLPDTAGVPTAGGNTDPVTRGQVILTARFFRVRVFYAGGLGVTLAIRAIKGSSS